MNRIEAALPKIRERIAALSPAEAADLDADMAVTFGEHFAYQNAQARAHVSGKLSTDEAQIIYIALGEVGSQDNGGWAKGTDLATKVVVTLTIGQLIKC